MLPKAEEKDEAAREIAAELNTDLEHATKLLNDHVGWWEGEYADAFPPEFYRSVAGVVVSEYRAVSREDA